MVERHEPPCGVDQRIDHGQIQAVPGGDLAPVVHARPAQRVGADPHPGRADGIDVDHVGQVVDVVTEVVVALRGLQRAGQRDALDARAVAQNLVGALGDCVGGVGVGWAAVGRVVFEAPVRGRVVRRRHDDPVGRRVGATAVVGEDGVADRRGRRIPVAAVHHRYYVVGGQHLQRGDPGRLGEAVRVPADEQRAGNAVGGAVLDDGLGDRQDVRLVERPIERRPAVARRAECHLLGDVAGIGLNRVIGRHQVGQIDKVFGLGRLTGARVGHHGYQFCPSPSAPGLRRSGLPPYAA